MLLRACLNASVEIHVATPAADLLLEDGRITGAEVRGHEAAALADAPTLHALAERIGVPPDELEATVERWNAYVGSGVDPDFHRGESAHDRWWGDPYNKRSVQATLGPLEEPPFYAIELKPGTIGTKGGPKIDASARVVDLDGAVIAGLYAVGNVSCPLGPGYRGRVARSAPGMTFGWIAGRHIAAS